MYANPYNSGYWAHVPLPSVYYPPYYYPHAGPSQDPRRRIHEYAAPQRIDLNPFIDAASRGSMDIAIWDARLPPQTVCRLVDKGRKRAPFSPGHFNQPATRPPLPKMLITLPEHEHTFTIEPGERPVTIGDVFRGVYAALRVEYGEEDWEVLGEEEQMMMHDQRCMRLTQESPAYEFDSYVRKIDALFERTIFGGLKQIGPVTDMLWELKLLKPKPPKERRGRY